MKVDGNFIIARPGYNKKFKRDVTWKELRDTFTLYKRIPLIIAGGSHFGPIDPNLAVGFVDATIDDDAQMIRGKSLSFLDSRLENLPEEIQQKLTNKEFIHASLGYELFDTIRKPDHILIGAKDPVFPDVGFAAEEEASFYYEETEGINKMEEQKEEAPEQPTDSIEDLRAEIRELKTLMMEMRPKEKATDVAETVQPEVQETPPPVEEPAPAPVQKQAPAIEPERKPIPKVSAPTEDDIFEAQGNSRVISLPLGGKQAGQEKQE